MGFFEFVRLNLANDRNLRNLAFLLSTGRTTMIEETAIVTRIASGQVWIKSRQDGACGGCAQQSSCGTATLSKLLPKREFSIDCDLPLHVGDEVLVAVDDSHLLVSSLLLYLLPLLPMMLGVALADAFLPSTFTDTWLPLLALSLLLTAFRLIHVFQDFFLPRLCFKPQIVGKASPK